MFIMQVHNLGFTTYFGRKANYKYVLCIFVSLYRLLLLGGVKQLLYNTYKDIIHIDGSMAIVMCSNTDIYKDIYIYILLGRLSCRGPGPEAAVC